jgi:hypothetical protein
MRSPWAWPMDSLPPPEIGDNVPASGPFSIDIS